MRANWFTERRNTRPKNRLKFFPAIVEPWQQRRITSTSLRLPEVSTMRNADRVVLCGCFVVAAVSLGGGVSAVPERGLRRAGDSMGGIDAGPGGRGGGAVGGDPRAQRAAGQEPRAPVGRPGTAAACTGIADPRLVVADQRILPLTGTEVAEHRPLSDQRHRGRGAGHARHHRRRRQRRIAPSVSAARRRSTSTTPTSPSSTTSRATSGATSRPTSRRSPGVRPPSDVVRDRRTSTSSRRRRTGGGSRPTSRRGSARSTPSCASPQTVNGYQVTFTVEEATGFAVDALLRSPQMLWRWEIGDAAIGVDRAGRHSADRSGAGDAARRSS